mgnify:CR=1 FL=1
MKIGQCLCVLKIGQKIIDASVCNVGAEVISASKMLTTALSLGVDVSEAMRTILNISNILEYTILIVPSTKGELSCMTLLLTP